MQQNTVSNHENVFLPDRQGLSRRSRIPAEYLLTAVERVLQDFVPHLTKTTSLSLFHHQATPGQVTLYCFLHTVLSSLRTQDREDNITIFVLTCLIFHGFIIL